ncbi:MAG: ChaN family lipoprotein, partial [Planctomycetota bacterium]|nr:ChaN family lipoprotein [Planctomycetota bacterium]
LATRIEPRESLLLFDGRSTEPMTWSQLLEAANEADVIIVGELHDDANGHQVQLALVVDAMARFENVALSMEMLDRSEQHIADDYFANYIDREAFIEQTASTKWRKLAMDYLSGEIKKREFEDRIMKPGWPDWEGNYQPIIDAAKSGGGSLVAANAPWARYSKLVTSEGYDDFDTMTPAQRTLVEKADVPPSGGYRERFWEVMTGRPEGEASESDEDESDDDAAHMDFDDEMVRRSFNAQMMYDATMADSIAKALAGSPTKVIHLVGQFHSDFEGGTVLELRRRTPGVKILTISMQRENVNALRDEDQDRADVVIYTIPPGH